ncbi:hypothetical protein HYE67_000051 [Fusarium culmorum]|uniref:Uncharacterized protein n=1 Tax=Fusarium culmorum TaxID=5516 RepID=A0A7S8HR46_FUSCU|nr:hypothetical protein HYE67_000051 [Fusarium culmorum]
MKTFATLGALAALFQQAAANLDAVTLFAKADPHIQEASATLVLDDIPSPITGDVALWSTIMMRNQDSFLQGVTQNSPKGLGYCSNLGNKWCNFALSGLEWNPSQGLSEIPNYNPLQAQLANANEDVGIALSQPDESFGHNGGWEQGSTGGEMSTSDGGKTWKFTTFEIPATDVPRS